MQIYRTEATVSKDKTVDLKDLPFAEGERVEVTIQRSIHKQAPKERYPLRGRPFRYIQPFDSVVEEDWETLQ